MSGITGMMASCWLLRSTGDAKGFFGEMWDGVKWLYAKAGEIWQENSGGQYMKVYVTFLQVCDWCLRFVSQVILVSKM